MNTYCLAYALNQESCNFLNEDLHALLQSAPDTDCDQGSRSKPVRPTNHMVTRSQASQKQYRTVSDYYMKLDSIQEHQEDAAPPQPQPTIEENKSMFKEIDRCYSKFKAEQELHKNEKENPENEIPYLTYGQFEYKPNNITGYFCKNLKEQLSSITLHSRKAQCLTRIRAAVSNINDTLEGKEIPHPPKFKPKAVVVHENVLPTIEHLIPKSSWSYETPSDKALKRPVTYSYNKLKPTIYHPDTKICKPLFKLSPNTTSPKFFEPANYTFTKVMPSGNKKQLRNNLMFEYPEHITFTAQANTNEFLCTDKNDFLLSNIGDIFEDDKPFQNIPTPHSINNMFNQNCKNPFKEHHNISTPECQYLLPVKRQRLCNEPSVNFFENFHNSIPAASDISNENVLFNCRISPLKANNCLFEYDKCFKRNPQFQQDNNFGNNEEFSIPTTRFYPKESFSF